MNLDQCLERFVDYQGRGLPEAWCQRAHGHNVFVNHRGVVGDTIIEWDGLGYLVGTSPAPPDLVL